ncbi:MAG: phosphoribosylformylglycinamidine cyclo-ligase [Armatimonadetes bacterium]|nr:phosphoribosylformylglycinamidine cyclo-ligase [Armatimonadota bacterium]
MSDAKLTYAEAGVDIVEADRALRLVGPAIRATHNERVIGGIGGFGGLFQASFPDMANPILVSSIDGVGTKTKVASMVGDWTGIGRDIVGHCVNDILCQGARPLFFMDYFATSRLVSTVFDQVVGSAAAACQEVGCALIGGETAEMPGVYVEEELDVVGSIVGVVDYEKRLPRSKPTVGDRLIGIASNGLHTNGYSLARRALFEKGGFSVKDKVPGSEDTIGEALLRPHRCYFSSVYDVLQTFEGVYGVAHITGGGIPGNLPRALPADLQAVVHKRAWEPLPIFRLIQTVGEVPDDEMYQAFNMGIGMILVVAHDQAPSVISRLTELGEHAAEIGKLRSGSNDVQLV